MFGFLVLIIILIIVLFVLISCVKIVPQAHAYVLERLGGYKETWSVGIHFKANFRSSSKESFFKRASCRFRTTSGYYER